MTQANANRIVCTLPINAVYTLEAVLKALAFFRQFRPSYSGRMGGKRAEAKLRELLQQGRKMAEFWSHLDRLVAALEPLRDVPLSVEAVLSEDK